MRTIDIRSWNRRQHFQVYRSYDHPHFNMCANVDITSFSSHVKQHKLSFTLATLYLITRSANDVPEFRYRIRPEGVIEHEVIHPSTTIMAENDLFTFCYFEYQDDFRLFNRLAVQQIEYTRQHPTLENMPGKDDVFYSTIIPWVSFTSFMHPMQLNPADCIPRFAWGKYFEEGTRIKMPLSVQGHHALMDGEHMGRLFTRLQEYLDQPEILDG